MKKAILIFLVIIFIMTRPSFGQTIITTHKNIFGTWNILQDKYVLGKPREANITFTVYETYVSVNDGVNLSLIHI